MGEARLRTAPSEAIVLLERQQGLVSDPVDLGVLALTLARAHLICSSSSRSIPYYAEAFEILERNGSSLDLLHCLDEYSWALISAGEADKAIELVDKTANLVDLGEVEARATYLWAKADLAHYMEDLTNGESYLREAVGLLRDAGREVPTRISALALVYQAAKEEVVVEADALNVVQDLVQEGETGEAMALMFNVALNIGDPEQKLRWWDRREDLAAELGQSYEILQTRLGRLVTLRQTGQFEVASGVAEELLESARKNEDPFVERMALSSRLFIDWCLDNDVSDDSVLRFIELSRAQEAWVPLCVDLLIREAPQAAEELLQEIWERISDEDKWRFSPRCAQLGRVDLVSELEGRGDVPFRPINLAYRSMAGAYLARTAGEHLKAAEQFAYAADMFEERKLRPEHALALAEQARCEVAAQLPTSNETVSCAVLALNAIGCESRASKLETSLSGR
jgi:tetratricopeptide (TPR) repeat protein